jgi:hypothetical protein
MLRTILALSVFAPAALAQPLDSSTIVQNGSISGGGAPGTQPVELDAFDDQGGTLTLESVQVEVLTSVIGGCSTNGSGIPTDVYARLVGDFSLGAQALVDTEALIDAQVSNVGPPAALTFFDTDSDSTTLTSLGDLATWIGTSEVTMSAYTEFEISETPPGSVSFGAGGSISWTVTYTYCDSVEPGTPYCFGTGCPCGNDDPGAGCGNSSGTGALLDASGSNSVALSNLGMHVSGLPANTVTILVIGDQQQLLPFNDGKLCIGGQIWRLVNYQYSGPSGTVDFDDIHAQFAQNSPPVTFGAGDAWNFQSWYRDSGGAPGSCGQGSNLSNAYAVTFAP